MHTLTDTHTPLHIWPLTSLSLDLEVCTYNTPESAFQTQQKVYRHTQHYRHCSVFNCTRCNFLFAEGRPAMAVTSEELSENFIESAKYCTKGLILITCKGWMGGEERTGSWRNKDKQESGYSEVETDAHESLRYSSDISIR